SPRPPRSSCRHRKRPPPRALQPLQIQTKPRYTLSASGFPLPPRQTVLATRFSQTQGPDAPIPFEKSGLAALVVVCVWAFSRLFHFLWGVEDPRLFDMFPLRYLFDAADVGVILVFAFYGVSSAAAA